MPKFEQVTVDNLESGFSRSGNIAIGFADPSTSETYPGWPLRNLLCLIAAKFGRSRWAEGPLRVIGLRQKSVAGGTIGVDESVVIDVVCCDVDSSQGDEPIIRGDYLLLLSFKFFL